MDAKDRLRLCKQFDKNDMNVESNITTWNNDLKQDLFFDPCSVTNACVDTRGEFLGRILDICNCLRTRLNLHHESIT